MTWDNYDMRQSWHETIVTWDNHDMRQLRQSWHEILPGSDLGWIINYWLLFEVFLKITIWIVMYFQPKTEVSHITGDVKSFKNITVARPLLIPDKSLIELIKSIPKCVRFHIKIQSQCFFKNFSIFIFFPWLQLTKWS